PGLDRRTVIDLVDHPSGIRLFPVGRLDFETMGLLLLTNDGEMANALTHPRYGLAKTYRAIVRGRLSDDDVESIERGIYLADRKEGRSTGASRTARVQVEIIKRDRDRTTLQITLKEGRNRQVRRMLASIGYPIKKLERVAIGPLRLKGVARGAWRELSRDELRSLRRTLRSGDGGPRGPKPGRDPVDTRRSRMTHP
ncbi:MAG: rRNA pseudouridine synthase, partial [Planctomycetes bacterium]|nr:rRNA pseudouridine synthase [Planctomycetota bacterium]